MITPDIIKLIGALLAIGINSAVLGMFIGKLSSRVEENKKDIDGLRKYIDDSIKKSQNLTNVKRESNLELIMSKIESIDEKLKVQDKWLEDISKCLVKMQLKKEC